jgi:hypothetical protein
MNQNADNRRSVGQDGRMIGAWIAIGAGFGVALGLVLQNLALGIAIGAALGTGIGASLEGRNLKSALDEIGSGRARLATLVGLGLLLFLAATGVALLFLFAVR